MTRRLTALLSGLPRGLLLGIVLFPVLVALFQVIMGVAGWRPEEILGQRASPIWVLAYVLAKSDSGAQLPAGSNLYYALVSSVVLSWLLLPRSFPRSIRGPVLLGFLALSTALLSALLSSHRAAALSCWLTLMLFLALGLLTLQMHCEEPLTWLPVVLKIGTGLVVFTALCLEAIYGPDSGRLSGSFHHPNIFGAFLLLGVPHLWEEERSFFRYLGVGLCLLCLTLTASRGVLVALSVAFFSVYVGRLHTLVALVSWALIFLGFRGIGLVLILGLLLSQAPRHWASMKANGLRLLLSAAICVSFYLLMSAGAENRWVKGVGSASFEARGTFWSAAVSMSTEKFPLGLGGDVFRRAFPRYQTETVYFSKFAHSLPLSWAAEWGWLFVGLLALAGLKAWPGLTREKRPWACGALAFFIHACVDVHVQFPALMGWFAVCLGMLWSPTAYEPEPAAPRSKWSIRPQLLVQYLTIPPLTLGMMHLLLGIYASHYAAVARLAARLEKPTEARALFLEAARLNPWEADYFRQASQVRVGEQGISEEFLENARRAVEIDPDRAVNYNVLGRLQEGAGEDGRQALVRALELDPVNYPSFYTHLAEAHLAHQEPERALAIAQEGWGRFPLILVTEVQEVRVEELRRQLAELGLLYGYLLLERENSLAQAEHVLRAAMFLEPSLREAKLALGLVLHRSGREQQGLEWIRELATEFPEWEPPRKILESIYGSEPQGSAGSK